MKRFKSLAWLVASLAITASVAVAEPPTVSWIGQSPDEPLAAPEGHAWIKWSVDTDADPLTLQYDVERTSPDDEPETRRVRDTSTFIAGLPEGTTVVRVRAVDAEQAGAWTEPLRIEVSYPSLRMVQILGALGSLLFVATVALILGGHARTRSTTLREASDG